MQAWRPLFQRFQCISECQIHCIKSFSADEVAGSRQMLWQTTIKCLLKEAGKLRQKTLKGVRLQKEIKLQIETWAQVQLLSWAYRWLLWERGKQTSRVAKTWVTSSKWWLSSIGSFAQSYNRRVLKIRVESLGRLLRQILNFWTCSSEKPCRKHQMVSWKP